MAFWSCQLEDLKKWFCYYYKLVKLLCYWPNINIKWHTYISFLAGDDFYEHTAVITRPVGNQMNEPKPGTQENKHGALNDITTFNDGAISSSNSVFMFVCLFVFLISIFFVPLAVVYSSVFLGSLFSLN